MPTHEQTPRFLRDFARLSPAERAAFLAMLPAFIDDLNRGSFRNGLRVKAMSGREGVWEMTWAPDGRATFELGPGVLPDQRHVVWRRVGTHAIFRQP